MSDEEEDAKPQRHGRAETMDDMFAASRQKFDMVLEILATKLARKVEEIDLEKPDALGELERMLPVLERLVFLNQMNRVKTRDLANFAPKKYARIASDEEMRRELVKMRPNVLTDEARNHQFPKRGPRGPREDVAPPPENPET